MEALFGIDTGSSPDTAINLFVRLQFPNPAACLVHSIESLLPNGAFPNMPDGSAVADLFEQLKHAGKAALQNAEAALEAGGVAAESELTYGSAAHQLIEHADRIDADLIAVTAYEKGALASFFWGSICRGLIIGAKQSILVAKGEIPQEGPLNVVLATDHSEYMDACVQELIRLSPRGIGKLTIVTAMDFEGARLAQEAFEAMESAEVGYEWTQQNLCRLNERLAERLRPLTHDIQQHVVDGPPVAAIRETMRETAADLLIVGAQGHGFFHRVAIGSVSLHEVVAEPWPVLVLRTRKE